MVLLSFGFSWKSNRIYPLRLFFTNQPLTPYLHSQNLLTLSLKKGFQDSDGTHLYKRQNGLWCNSLSRLSYSNSKETEGESFWAFIGYLTKSVKFSESLRLLTLYELTEKILMKGCCTANMNVALEVVNWFMALAILTGFGIEYYRAHHSTMCL